MKINARGIEIIKSSESLHDGDLSLIGLQPKMCPAGYWTEGYGDIMINPATKKYIKGIENKSLAYSLISIHNETEANKRLSASLYKFENQIDSLKLNLNQNQFSALVSFIYNLGFGQLLVSTMLKKMKVNLKDESIKTEFAKWNKGGGIVQPGLIIRRKKESDLYFN